MAKKDLKQLIESGMCGEMPAGLGDTVYICRTDKNGIDESTKIAIDLKEAANDDGQASNPFNPLDTILRPIMDRDGKENIRRINESMNKQPMMVIVPKNEYDFFGKEAVNALEDKYKVLVVPVDYTDPFENSMAQYATAHLATAVNVPTSRLFELPDSAKERIEIDTTDIPNPRYHDRTFPKHYDKKKRAKRRQQKQSRRRNK